MKEDTSCLFSGNLVLVNFIHLGIQTNVCKQRSDTHPTFFNEIKLIALGI